MVVLAGATAHLLTRSAAEFFYRRLTALPHGDPLGPLDDHTLAALMATTLVLLPAGIEPQRYEDCFRWRAEHLPGYKGIYDRFAATVDRAARQLGEAGFAHAAAPAERKVLEPLAEARAVLAERSRRAALRVTLLGRDWFVFERHIVRDLLALFARTDAWLLAGYPSHPGVARGLDAYHQPVPARLA